MLRVTPVFGFRMTCRYKYRGLGTLEWQISARAEINGPSENLWSHQLGHTLALLSEGVGEVAANCSPRAQSKGKSRVPRVSQSMPSLGITSFFLSLRSSGTGADGQILANL